eukprot:Gregarina_sp_Poly_1__10960@NODE_862_length_5940_cov_638_515410_g285_i2_p5_GENE_NODE_862_length_5940_cov_638_515410_g285_i2NODE_862_length_5940_cov_638_515410_g285_i2_p5_ORF_typecomplete_len172_score24_90TMEM18/PF14770_6/2e21_NODE_862_length_5940_cov_638_515410_g285_i212511766
MASQLLSASEFLLQHLTAEETDGSLTADFIAFISEINWSHPLFTCLLIFHVTFLVAVCTAAYKTNVRGIISLAVVSFIASRSAETMNAFFAREQHWRTILKLDENYFRDPSGAFVSLVWSAPFVVSSFVSVVRVNALPWAKFSIGQIVLLFRLSQLLVRLKRKQLRQRKLQ